MGPPKSNTMTIGTKVPDLLGLNEKGEEIRLSQYA